MRDIRAIFSIPNLTESPDINQNSDGGISEFQISAQSLITENQQNFKFSDYIDVKLGQKNKTKLVQENLSRNLKQRQKVDNDVISTNCDTIVIFQIYGQLGAIQKQYFGTTVYKPYIFFKSSISS